MTAKPAFHRILEPLQLRHKTLRNRINFGAHTANMAEDGLPGSRHLGYYRERARGGAAMIVVEPMPVHQTARLTRGNFRHDDDAVIPGFRAITEACKAEGAVMVHQLYHVGQHGDFDNSYSANWSPSGLPSYHDGDGSHRMREAEIEEIIESFVRAAVRAKACGFDGVELFGPYNSLIEQFWLPWSNRRDDRWGGSFENRMRFSTEITSRIRAAAGDEFIIGLASSIDTSVDVGMGTELLQEIAAYHDTRALIDYITCGTGSYFDHSSVMPTFLFADKLGAPHAQALKEVCKHIRVQAESHIRTPENANEVISSRQADMVSIVRGQIADPYWVKKVAGGRDTEVRGCISCNQMCWGRRSRDYWISCLVNPSAGREFEWGGDTFIPARTPKRVLVVGGGPAGLEAARVAAERGHSVTLAEAASQLGGQFRLAGMQPRRSQILELIDWYEQQLTRLGVRVLLNAPLDAAEIAGHDVDEIVIATGSQPAGTGFQRGLPGQDRLPGVDLPNVWSVEDVMTRTARLGDHVLLIDDTGDWRGLGTALEIAARGHSVTVVTAWPVLGRYLQRTESDGVARARLKTAGGGWITDAVVKEWHGDGATVRCHLDGTETVIRADTLVLATTNVSDTWVLDDLAEQVPALMPKIIGDALAPRLAVAAIYEGRVLGQSI
ncbi:FAD-dependent oxidoreductase [Mesorhizobium waimense]|uniref:FAD-dependent oxidoreductase n=1 Tax=Mesorhizobium waimense TaxID=1300307 RepID=A0A3A5KXW0_9HYPH|nr:FAD-dependent oxidoreductase [Mesorhizobium waimense]RJT41685.1 FAD-dependent oxidoreductase [Mesorhizobium waimense]